MYSLALIIFVVSEKKAFEHFPIGSNVNLCIAVAWKVLYKVSSFSSTGQQIWLPRAILVSDWLMLSKSSPLKLLGQIKPNLVGSIYVRSSIMEPYEEAL
jgi:hypothetical protein